jgi:heptaprenyl diphosphate synthase
MNIKKIAILSMLLSLSVVLNIIESMIPIIGNIIPGVKLGLANAVILFAIYIFSLKEVVYISLTRVFLVGMFRTGLFSITFFFSLGGSVLSVILMYLVKKYTKLSIVGVSVIGAISHSIGQILMGMVLLKTTLIIFYLPWILFLSIPTGIVIGLITKEVLSYYQENNFKL